MVSAHSVLSTCSYLRRKTPIEHCHSITPQWKGRFVLSDQVDLDKDKCCDDFNTPIGRHHVSNSPGAPLPQDVSRGIEIIVNKARDFFYLSAGAAWISRWSSW